MKVMVMVKATLGSEANEMPSKQLMDEMMRYNEELIAAGIMKGGDGLRPSRDAVRVKFSGKDRTVVNGPFAETKELVAGYWMWEVKSMEEAVEWVRKCPNPMMEDSDIDIRPLFGAEDFKEWDPSGEFSAKEQDLQHRLVAQQGVLHPYLCFSGNCEEALGFYRETVGAKIGMVMRFSDSPEPPPPGMLPAGHENKIMHCEFTVGNTTIMASDGRGENVALSGFNLALALKDIPAAEQTFSKLAAGGKIDMPLTKTFWSPAFGMVTDRFGVSWMVMVYTATAP
jgi:uncharacterized glyoxalase superfamily protein PhnB